MIFLLRMLRSNILKDGTVGLTPDLFLGQVSIDEISGYNLSSAPGRMGD
jgi:hypothetical protein